MNIKVSTASFSMSDFWLGVRVVAAAGLRGGVDNPIGDRKPLVPLRQTFVVSRWGSCAGEGSNWSELRGRKFTGGSREGR